MGEGLNNKIQFYSKNNENVTKITIFFVKIVSDKNLRKT
jgi:hypothetical protein